jgi:hypothetical protein
MASSIFTQRAIQDLPDYSLIFYGELLWDFKKEFFFNPHAQMEMAAGILQIGERAGVNCI